MNNLKELWQGQKIEVESFAFNLNAVENMVKVIRKEERKRKIQLLVTIPLTVLTIIFLYKIYTPFLEETSRSYYLGFLFIFASIIWNYWYSFFTHVTINTEDINLPSSKFISICYRKLVLRKILIVVGPLVYVIFFFVGLYLTILKYLEENIFWGVFFLLLGCFGAVYGWYLNIELKKFHSVYGDIIQKLDHMSKDKIEDI